MIKFYTILGLSMMLSLVSLLSVSSNAAAFQYITIANPATDIPSTNKYFKNLDEAIQAFNNARNQDSTVRTTQKNLRLPANFADLSWQDQYFVILNRERVGRGLLSNTYPIQKLNTIAQNYSKALIDANQFTHTLGGLTPYQRMDNDPEIKACKEFQPYGESLYLFKYKGFNFVTPKLVALQGLYNFLYVDAGSAWGHRIHLLSNYQNNNKARNHEGHSGLGMATTVEDGWTKYILTQNTFDPKPTCTL